MGNVNQGIAGILIGFTFGSRSPTWGTAVTAKGLVFAINMDAQQQALKSIHKDHHELSMH